MEKPWATAEGGDATLNESESFSMPTEKVGLWVFLSAITVLFTLLIISYGGRMTLGTDWRPLPDPWLLWPNTALLVLSSVFLQRARVSARRGQMDGVRTRLLAAGGFSFAFLAGQLFASYELIGLGYFASTNPANAFFYLLTGMHAVHLIGGLVAWARTNAKVRRGVEARQVALSIELCAIYWHFLLLVWLILFSLMLMT
jgi:cytochrome c oxidase subunit 3